MVGKRKAPAFRSLPKLNKNATPLQIQMHARRTAEMADIRSRAAGRSLFGPADPEPSQGNLPLPNGYGHNTVANDADGTVNDEDDWRDIDADIPHAPEVQDPIIQLLNHSSNQSRRLEQERQWMRQYKLFLPLFLASRDRSSNWSNAKEALKDVKLPCSCSGKDFRVRVVDMVDIEGVW